MNLALTEFWGKGNAVRLAPVICVPEELSNGVVRCNVEYEPAIGAISYKRYKKRRISSLRLVTCNFVDYRVKYLDRSILEALLDRRADCDEIMIVKDDFITDTTMSNLIFFDGAHWITPSTPLLPGTCRARLLAEGRISERVVRPSDLPLYQGVKLINAMRDIDDDEIIPVSEIV
jgi:4-amino-4-deoxychorismate lyase